MKNNLKKVFAILLSLTVLMSMIPLATGVAYAGEPAYVKTVALPVAQINEATYTSLADAVASATNGATIKMLADVDAVGGISVPSGKNFTIDLDRHHYYVEKPGAGSAGTTTQAFQLLENSNITFKNGTIACTAANKDFTWEAGAGEKGVAMVIQNYADLTLENMVIDGTNIAHNGNNTRYVLSNNCGTVSIKDSTIIATGSDFAFDSCKYGTYEAPTVTVENSTITGKVEKTGGNIVVKSGVFSDLATAVNNAESGATIKLLEDTTLTQRIDVNPGAGKKVTIDLNGKTISSTETCGNGSVFNLISGTATIKNGKMVGIAGPTGLAEPYVNECDVITVRNGAVATLTNLNISVDSATGACAYAFDGGKIYVTGGTYVNNAKDADASGVKDMLLNQADKKSQAIFVTGGRFIGLSPGYGDNSGEPSTFLADVSEYTVIKHGENVWEVVATGDARAVARSGDQTYPTLYEAYCIAKDSTDKTTPTTITLLDNCTTAGIGADGEIVNLVLDLNGHTVTFETPAVGSTGYKTQALRFLKGSTVTIKSTGNRGSLKIANEQFKMFINNYANLTFENVSIDGQGLVNYYSNGDYVLSNNSGSILIKDSEIIADITDFAFDSCKSGDYAIPTVTVENSIITGKIEQTGGNITIKSGLFSVNPSAFVVDGTNTYLKSADSKYYVGTEPEHSADKNTWKYDEKAKLYVEDTVAVNTGTIVIPTENVVTNKDNKTSDQVTTASVDTTKKTETKVDAATGKTETVETKTATVNTNTAKKIVEQAVENKSAEVVVNAATSAKPAEENTASSVALPETTVKEIAEKTDAAVTIKTDNATVTLDDSAVKTVADAAGTAGEVKLVVETVSSNAEEYEVELKVVTSNGEVHQFNGNVTVTVVLPEALAAKKVVCVYKDDKGNVTKIPGKKNADGSYTFTTTHFSSYTIMEEDQADALVKESGNNDKIIKGVQNTTIKATAVAAKTASGKKGIKISWKKSKGYKVDNFVVYKSTKKSEGFKKVVTSKSGKSSYYINTKNIKPGKTYYYKVRGARNVAGEVVYTKWSNKVSAAVK